MRVVGASGDGPWQLGLGLLGDVAHKRVLDVGAGGGFFAERLRTQGAVVTGCDLVDQWQFPEIPFVQADLDCLLPFGDESFDGVTIVEALNYAECVSHVFREAYRLLCPGGIFVATFPNCLCLESRLRFLINGTYRWFPHPSFRGGEKEIYADLGRDPLRITTALLQAQLVGFAIEEVAFGGAPIALPAALAAMPLVGLTQAHNRLRSDKVKVVPPFAAGLNAIRYRTVGFRARKAPIVN